MTIDFNEYNGKVFAHSFISELNEIQKEASRMGTVTEMAGIAGRKLQDLARSVTRGTGLRRTNSHQDTLDVVRRSQLPGRKPFKALPIVKQELKKEQLKRFGKGAATVAGTGLVGGGIYAGTRNPT